MRTSYLVRFLIKLHGCAEFVQTKPLPETALHKAREAFEGEVERVAPFVGTVRSFFTGGGSELKGEVQRIQVDLFVSESDGQHTSKPRQVGDGGGEPMRRILAVPVPQRTIAEQRSLLAEEVV